MSVFTRGEEEKEKKEGEDNPFTHYYGQLLHQGNMLQDLVRTGTYQQSMLQNRSNFEDKVVLDVGTGTGILSFFAAQDLRRVSSSEKLVLAPKKMGEKKCHNIILCTIYTCM
jgi:2-polyprenyl-3-methyl-5-hydroxy-6-metoxy-1,4-benzoquinol methylase